ncbi:hypothetical protein T492DRAFT_872910, partial [Pavlovales sp. CCMP2436]
MRIRLGDGPDGARTLLSAQPGAMLGACSRRLLVGVSLGLLECIADHSPNHTLY